MKIIIINGPNLNLIGKREPSIYGKETLDVYFEKLKKEYAVDLEVYQSNIEGALIDKIHHCGFSNYDGIILNAGAYTHTSIAIADAIKSIKTPVVEIHISNIHSREKYRHHSYISPHVKGIIIGFGINGYKLAIESFVSTDT